MHKTIVVAGEPATVRRLSAELPRLDGVVSVALQEGGSVKPAGDVLSVHVLNSTADEVLRAVEVEARAGRVVIALGEASAIVAASHREQLAKDDDEALWEEMESQLRNHGRVSINYLVLMVLGGAISAGAFTLDPVGQTIAFVGASIISPGFEPIAKMSQGVVLRRRSMFLHGAWAALAGYGTLIVAAAATFAALSALGEADASDLAQPFAKSLSTFHLHSLLPSMCAALAGGVMVASLRDTYVVGPLMILAVIPAAALVGGAFALGDFALALRAGARCGLDALSVLVLVALVMLWKQRTKHRRAMLP